MRLDWTFLDLNDFDEPEPLLLQWRLLLRSQQTKNKPQNECNSFLSERTLWEFRLTVSVVDSSLSKNKSRSAYKKNHVDINSQ